MAKEKEEEPYMMELTVLNMRVIFLMIIMKDKENMFGKMVIIILDNF